MIRKAHFLRNYEIKSTSLVALEIVERDNSLRFWFKKDEEFTNLAYFLASLLGALFTLIRAILVIWKSQN